MLSRISKSKWFVPAVFVLTSFSIRGMSSATTLFWNGGPATTPLSGNTFFSPSTGDVGLDYFDNAEFALANLQNSAALALGALDNANLALGPDAETPSTLSIARLLAGVLVGPSSTFGNTNAELASADRSVGNWNAFGNGFIGLSLAENDGTHYGWANIIVNPDLTVTLNNFAYNTIAGQSVTTEVVAPTPEPSALALLAIGFGSLSLWKKRKLRHLLLALCSPAWQPSGAWSTPASNRQASRSALPGVYLGAFLCSLGLLAQSPPTTGRPGLTDPLGNPSRYTLFSNDQLLIMSPGGPNDKTVAFSTQKTDANLKLGNELQRETQTWEGGYRWVGAAGHVLGTGTPKINRDDVVYAHRSGGNVQVEFAGSAQNASNFFFESPYPTLADHMDELQFGPVSDFLAIATGDLDKLPDANGVNHDEVVVVYASPTNIPQAGTDYIEVAVLNYENGPGKPTVALTHTDSGHCGPACFASYDYLKTNPDKAENRILGVDNILAVAVGDFDGDGFNEIAVLHVGDQSSTYLSLFRYRNRGDGHPSIELLSTHQEHPDDLSTVKGVASWAATVSLAAGDFDGDGKDELVVGREVWWKYSQGFPSAEYDPNNASGHGLFGGNFHGTALVSKLEFTTFRSSRNIGTAKVIPPTPIPVSNASNSNPVRFVIASNTNLPAQIVISGATGKWAALNSAPGKPWPVTLNSDGTFSVSVDAGTFGSFSGQTLNVTAPQTETFLNVTTSAGSLPTAVTLTGGTGKWAAVNGTWSVSATASGLAIPVDPTTFGDSSAQSFTISTYATSQTISPAVSELNPVTLRLPSGVSLASIPSQVNISGVQGVTGIVDHSLGCDGKQGWSLLNGIWPVAVSEADVSITLPVDATCFGALSSSMSFSAAAPFIPTANLEVDPHANWPRMTAGEGGGERGYPSVGLMDYRDGASRSRLQIVPGLLKWNGADFGFTRREFAAAWNDPYPCPTDRTDPCFLYTSDVIVGTFTVANDGAGSSSLDVVEGAIQLARANNQRRGFDTSGTISQRFSLTAGGYKGASFLESSGNPPPVPNPRWSLALSGWDNAQEFTTWVMDPPPQITFLDTVERHGTGVLFTQYQTATSGLDGDSSDRYPLISYDYSGDSVYLGAPIHTVVPQWYNFSYALEEPPKHTAWKSLTDCPNPTNEMGVCDTTRYPDFYVEMKDDQNNIFSTSTKDTDDWNVGGGLATSAKVTTKVGVDGFGILEENAEISAGFKLKANYDHNQHENSYRGNYYSYGTGSDVKTLDDDALVGQVQLYDLWRYRIYGIAGSNGNNTFYDLVFPGPSIPVSGGGLSTDLFDVYQPVHENGNVLSYPPHIGNCTSADHNGCPSDMGPYSYQVDNNGDLQTGTGPLAPEMQINLSGATNNPYLVFSNGITHGSDVGYTNGMQASLDLIGGAKGEASVPFVADAKIKTSVDVNAHGGFTLGHSTTKDSTATASRSVSIFTESVHGGWGYRFYPMMWISGGSGSVPGSGTQGSGALKVTHTIDAPNSTWWLDNYASQPDPALNLPFRFNPVYSNNNVLNGYAPNSTIARKQMRGFFVRNPASSLDDKGNHDQLLGPATVGTQLELDARVYNYSLDTTHYLNNNNVEVQFWAIPYDPSNDNEICTGVPDRTVHKGGQTCPVQYRKQLTDANTKLTYFPVANLNTAGQVGGMQTAKFVADARSIPDAFGTQILPGTVATYRIYVDLKYIDPSSDPKHPIGEIYGPEKPCTAAPCFQNNDPAQNLNTSDPNAYGQNNEGFGYLSVQAAPLPEGANIPLRVYAGSQ
ncbi:MAG: VCBS repeat-containing protein, partial [Acidobacteriota bacterium]|nr:VCBS repeat-containing protein [Acidobacteriota bacterium]